MDRVKSNSVQGKFVNQEQIHLTLEFLGEIKNHRLDLIKEIMKELDFGTFSLHLTNIGYFKRREGNIYWLGIEDNDTLLQMKNQLHQRLLEKGFELEDREYRPHITIGRKVILKSSFQIQELDDIVGKLVIDIDQVDLMKSEMLNGKLVYTVVHSRHLGNPR